MTIIRLVSAVPLVVFLLVCGYNRRDVSESASTADLNPKSLEKDEPRQIEFDRRYLEVTPAAEEKAIALAREEGLRYWWLRYEMVPGGCSGFQNKLWLESTRPSDNEFEYRAGNIRFVLLKSQRELVQGIRIDWAMKDGKKGFVVTSPNATPKTNAAVYKWIMDEYHKRNPDLDPAKKPEPESDD